MLIATIHNNQSQGVDTCTPFFHPSDIDFQPVLVDDVNDYRNDQSLREKFNELYQKWFEETCVFSDPNKFTENENFKEIVSLGEPVVPFIIEKIQDMPSDLVKSLNLIYNQRVSERKVSISEACRLWIEKLRH